MRSPAPQERPGWSQTRPSDKREKYEFERKTRRRIRQRDHDACAVCKRTEAQLDIAHSVACDSCEKLSNVSESEAEALCDWCHVGQRHLTIHHQISCDFAIRHSINPAIIKHELNGVCVCPECHANLDAQGNEALFWEMVQKIQRLLHLSSPYETR